MLILEIAFSAIDSPERDSKCGFYGLIVLYFGGTNQVMQNPIPKLWQAFIISKEPVFLSEKLKTWASATIEFNNFCWNFAHVFYLAMSTKNFGGFFYFV